MSNETKAKKENELDTDNNFDLQFIKTLSPAFKWVLVLPIASLATFVIQIGYGFIVELTLSNSAQDGIASIIGNSTAMLTKYAMFIIAATSTVPAARSRKFVIATVLALIGALLCVGGTAIAISVAVSTDNTMLIATLVASMVGLLSGIWKIRSATSKPLTEENKVSQL